MHARPRVQDVDRTVDAAVLEAGRAARGPYHELELLLVMLPELLLNLGLDLDRKNGLRRHPE